MKNVSKIFFLILIILLVSTMIFYVTSFTNDRSTILSKCTGHFKNNMHYHFYLEILQENEKIPLPSNVGVYENCIHPIHTHDASGLVHVDYPEKIHFTLGDFFDMQGIIFHDRQIGSIKTFDGYKIIVRVGDKNREKDYRNILLEDKKDIKIQIVR